MSSSGMELILSENEAFEIWKKFIEQLGVKHFYVKYGDPCLKLFIKE